MKSYRQCTADQRKRFRRRDSGAGFCVSSGGGRQVQRVLLCIMTRAFAAKTLDFDRTISITNGMPFLRTSVDHGTAFDIAGSGKAGSVSMTEAILLAAKYAPFFNRNQ